MHEGGEGHIDSKVSTSEDGQTSEFVEIGEERFRHFFELGLIGMAITSPTKNWIDFNDQMCKILGYHRHELIQKTWAEMTHPEDLAGDVALFDRIMSGEIDAYSIDKRFIRKNGEIIHTTISVKCSRRSDGSVKYLAVLLEDITERKRAEEALFYSRQTLRAVLDSIPQRVFWKDKNSVYLGCNRPFAKDMGFSDPSEVIGKTDFEASWKENADLYRGDDKAVIESGVPKLNYGEPQLRSDGTKIWLRTSKVPLHGRDGSVIGVLGTYEDITDLNKAEEALELSNRFNEALLKTIPFGMNIVDKDGRVLFLNATMEGLVGNMVLNQFCWQVYKDDSHQCSNCPLAADIEIGETRVLESSGVLGGRTFEITHTGMNYHGQKAILEVFHDITDHKRAQQALHEKSQELLQAQKLEAIGKLAGGVAHDFNNALMAISGYTELLRMQMPDALMQEQITEIQKAVSHGANLTRQLLAFGRKQFLSPTVLDLNKCLERMQTMLRTLIGDDIELLLSLDESLHHIKADAGQTEQIIVNLAINSKDAMPQGGKLTLETINVYIDAAAKAAPKEMAPGEYVLMSITDTGCGMDQATMSRIFEPFFTTKTEGGTGLGLSTVYGIVKQSGAQILVSSECGKGTTFNIYFPAITDESAVESTPPASEEISGHGELILLVDDNRTVRTALSGFLKMKGYSVLEAEDGSAAISIVKSHGDSVGLVISDIVMPRMSGYQLAKSIRSQLQKPRILLMSGYTDEAVRRSADFDDNIAFIQKPFSMETLLQKIQEMLS